MEQTHAKALTALEPFLALTKSASSPRAAADLVLRATSSPNTFIFAELLATSQIQSLASSSEYAGHLTLLQIFSHGTYRGYLSTPSLPPLNVSQRLKLRQLTLLTMAQSPSDLSYTSLLSSLDLETERELEDLVITAIYAGLLQATLDPYHKIVQVASISPLRDLEPDSIPQMLSTLSAWSIRCESTLADLEQQIANVRHQSQMRQKEELDWTMTLEQLLDAKTVEKSLPEEIAPAGGGRWGSFAKRVGVGGGSKRSNGNNVTAIPALENGDDMDVDDEDAEDEKRGKKRGFGSLNFGR